MIKITMFSTADKVKGQGVGSAYLELLAMLKKYFSKEFSIEINTYKAADISHYHTVDFVYYLSTFLWNRGVKLGYVHFLPETLEGSIKLLPLFQKVFNWYVLSFYKRMDHLVVVNPSFIEKLVALGVPEERITYIPNFVSPKVFYEAQAEQKTAWRKENNLSEEDFVVLGVGQIQQRKGIDDFVQLAIQNPEVQFIWAGGFSFGKITDGYQKYQKIYDNPPKNLRFTGIIERDEIVQYYNMADLFLLPSYNELFPMSILEAFSCGTPVMLRNLDLYDSILKETFVTADDIDEMQVKLVRLVENPDELHDFQEKSRRAAQRYSEESCAATWLSFYTELAKKKK
ncbi:glycosyltransferase [Enterococcus sp. JM4C]|uniref:glycosyltransferase family 4 protein n=1 Tax=Candidatus Enterococcus huntleyi TaxID=1857217 RepID=UPI00137AB0CC|nr:glycosyltransferase family 4 protein [Enterococcus sp. JM4C]KAF1296403.1 glycosyltransferase [Enterococcus sp. JM4C]